MKQSNKVSVIEQSRASQPSEGLIGLFKMWVSVSRNAPAATWSGRIVPFFLVACYATLHHALSVHWSVGLSVHPSVTLNFMFFFAVFGLTAPAQVIK